ncbi:PREDICTED: uncharacterized protein LOC109159120 [Ipomoea nil]|uniref:uncharacterized protein LOC109159120 n=1 Tax=Ipomoea nil TaxID=35883 RepID=UPI000901FE12|nr:PREDICTED: uncharacterized protein LOC109159120 [Ipomoea nil]
MMTLKEKVYEVGYKKEDNIRLFNLSDNGLVELLTDEDACVLANYVVRPKVVEIWVVLRVVGNDETNGGEAEISADESEGGSDWLQGDSAGEYENEETGVDDLEFLKYIDPNVEYGGDEDGGCDRVEENTETLDPKYINAEIHFSGSEGEETEGNVRSVGYVRESGEGNGRECVPPRPVLPSPLWLGKTFLTKGDFREAVKTYGLQFGKELKFVKNDKVRCIAKCVQEGCNWRVNCRRDPDEQCWRIIVLVDEHNDCAWVHENRLVTASLIAKRWRNQIDGNSEWKTSEFRKKVCTEDHHDLTVRQAYNAMCLAKKAIKGELEDNFNKIWNYELEIKKTNPNTRFLTKLSDLRYEGGKHRLLRVYICWEACREGFKHCRPLVGVDGCHLRGKAGGMMLTAIGVDANDSIFPIAYAIVEGENKDSWCWFLKLLKTDIGLNNLRQQNYTFMSDKQKGLIPAFEEVLPLVNHRYCVRHLHGNMQVAGFGGLPLKNALWKAARATTISTFKDAMRELRDLDSTTFQWLNDKHPSEWSKSHFNTTATSDMLVNNICESFNAMIKDARDSPLINCLEIVRKQIMIRLFECRKQAAQWSGTICPGIVKKISVFEEQAGGYWGFQSDEFLFEIKGSYDQHQVDLRAKTCSCRKWDLTGLPCRHVIRAIWLKKGNGPIYEYVDSCYTVDTYVKTYSGSIHPMAGPSEWPQSDIEPPLPPLVTTKVGRPKKLRIRSAGEANKGQSSTKRQSRKHVSLHCKICKQKGHNSRRCPDKSAYANTVQNQLGAQVTHPAAAHVTHPPIREPFTAQVTHPATATSVQV